MSDEEIGRLMACVTLAENGCWIWTAGRTGAGYGAQAFRGRTELAHRISYELFVGPAAGLILDHTCHSRDFTCLRWDDCPHRACVNPGHLEPVTQKQNVQRGKAHVTHCPHGHSYDEANTYIWAGNGGRACRTCRAKYAEANRKRRRAALKKAS